MKKFVKVLGKWCLGLVILSFLLIRYTPVGKWLSSKTVVSYSPVIHGYEVDVTQMLMVPVGGYETVRDIGERQWLNISLMPKFGETKYSVYKKVGGKKVLDMEKVDVVYDFSTTKEKGDLCIKSEEVVVRGLEYSL